MEKETPHATNKADPCCSSHWRTALAALEGILPKEQELISPQLPQTMYGLQVCKMELLRMTQRGGQVEIETPVPCGSCSAVSPPPASAPQPKKKGEERIAPSRSTHSRFVPHPASASARTLASVTPTSRSACPCFLVAGKEFFEREKIKEE